MPTIIEAIEAGFVTPTFGSRWIKYTDGQWIVFMWVRIRKLTYRGVTADEEEAVRWLISGIPKDKRQVIEHDLSKPLNNIYDAAQLFVKL